MRAERAGNTAPRSAMTTPKTSIPALAAPPRSPMRIFPVSSTFVQLLGVCFEDLLVVVLLDPRDIRRNKGNRLHPFGNQARAGLRHQRHGDEDHRHGGSCGD